MAFPFDINPQSSRGSRAATSTPVYQPPPSHQVKHPSPLPSYPLLHPSRPLGSIHPSTSLSFAVSRWIKGSPACSTSSITNRLCPSHPLQPLLLAVELKPTALSTSAGPRRLEAAISLEAACSWTVVRRPEWLWSVQDDIPLLPCTLPALHHLAQPRRAG